MSENRISVPEQHGHEAYLAGDPGNRIPGDRPAILAGLGMVDPDSGSRRVDLLRRLSHVLDRRTHRNRASAQIAHRLRRQNGYFAGVPLTVIHRHSVNSSRLVVFPNRDPFPDQ